MDIPFLIFIGVISRLIPHPANMTAVGGLAVFSGAQKSVTKALFVVFSVMIITDMMYGFHAVMWATYGSLFLAVILGHSIRGNKTALPVISATIGSSVIFYLVTNFAVWAAPGSMYPKTLQGLFQSYVMAIPFFRNSITGDIIWSCVFFTAYRYVPTVVSRFLQRPILIRE